MLNEEDIIEICTEGLPAGKGRLTSCFESDAERLHFTGSEIVISTDEFSAEDLIPESDPFGLGWNIASGAISDVLAAGGDPCYYLHALTVGLDWDREYLTQFVAGVSKVLHEYDITFAGGDTGCSHAYRCTPTVIGYPGLQKISRVGIAPGDKIYLTGSVGRGNVNAAIELFKEQKPEIGALFQGGILKNRVLNKEVKSIHRYARACIDTSDGLFNAVSTLGALNDISFVLDTIPYDVMGLQATEVLGLPKELLLLGECGEYELLCALPPCKEEAFLKEVGEIGGIVRCIGEFTSKKSKSKLMDGGRSLVIDTTVPRARNFSEVKEYLESLLKWTVQWISNG
jgi:thiamine-monophosphate kinase